MRKRGLIGLAALAILFAGALVAGCGGDDDDDANGGSEPQPTAASEENGATDENDGEDAPSGGTTISVDAFDFGYDPESITATAGQEITVDLNNTGETPHTFTIDGVVDSGTVEAGDSGSISFTPAESGELSFYCTIHTAEVMSGTLQVN